MGSKDSKSLGLLSSDPQSTSSSVPLLSDTEAAEGSEAGTSQQGSFSKSSLLHGSQKYGRNNPPRETEATRLPKDEKMSTIPDTAASPISPRFSSDSANERLLSDTEETLVEEDEKPTENHGTGKKSPFNTADYKIAVSHFLVRTAPLSA